MRASIFISMKWKERKKFVFTEAVRVNWLVTSVSSARDEACNLMLFEVVIGRLVINAMRYSRAFAYSFKCWVYSASVDMFSDAKNYCSMGSFFFKICLTKEREWNSPSVHVCFLTVTPKYSLQEYRLANFLKEKAAIPLWILGYLLATAKFVISPLILLNTCESEVITCAMMFWLPLDSSWTIGFETVAILDCCTSLTKLAIAPASGTTMTDGMANSVTPSSVSRTRATIVSINVLASPAGSCSRKLAIIEKASITRREGSVVQPNIKDSMFKFRV